MGRLKYNISLFGANILFALNYSLFVSLLEGDKLSIGAIYILQVLGLFIVAMVVGGGAMVRSCCRGVDIVIISLTAVVSALGWSYASLYGMSLTSPIDAATVASVGPSLTLIFAHLLGLRRVTGVRVVGLLLSLVGVATLVVTIHPLTGNRRVVAGNMVLVAAVLVAAINTLIFKPQLERYGLRRVLLIYSVAAVVVSLPLFVDDLRGVDLLKLGWGGLLEACLLLLAGGALPLVMLLEGTEHLTALHTSLYRYLQPLITAAVVVARGQAQFTWVNCVAIVMIIAGGVALARGVDRAG
ncbi:MAG: EamA family transporter [Rikenellaceae bacterium]